MPRKGAAGGKKKPLKNKSKGGKGSMTPEDIAFKKKQAEDRKAAAAMAKKLGKKK
jgi:hypothetical protein